MLAYPAIDIKDGKCVRLLQGRAEDSTVYGRPADMAARWVAAGAKRLHVVDLDGAFSGEGRNIAAIREIIAAANGMPVQLGGGIRSMRDIEERLELGVARVILGTAAILDFDMVRQAAERYPNRIVAGIDARDGMAAVKGWTEVTDVSAAELGIRLKSAGIAECVYTDISRDGMLKGVSLEQTKNMIEKTGLDVIASGGVGSIEDILRCKAMGCCGVILGKALYDGRIDAAEAIAAAEGEDQYEI